MEKFFVSRPIFAISLAIVIVLVGAISITQLPIEQYPDITPPVVEVSATYDGADAETVNNAVATPVAQAVMGVSDMLYMQATSANDGSMTLQVTFDIGSDPDLDAIFTQNNVSSATAELPATVTRQGVTTRKTMTGFLMVYSLHSDGRYDGEFLSNYAYINLQNELLKIDGVGKVSIMGAGEYAMRIWLRPDVLKYYGIAVDEVTAAIEKQGGIYPAGQFGAEPAPDGVSYTYTVTMPPQISTAGEFADIVVRTTSSGEQIRLGDIAEVSLGSQTYGVSSSYESDPTAMIVVYQQPGSNAVAVGSKVRAAMERLSERFPDGIEAATIVDSTTSIDAGVKDIFRTLIIALLLVILIIYLFLQDWRATVIPLVAIPVSLVGAFALFPLLGFSINIISLLGLVLAIGLVVDDAIVVVEYRAGHEPPCGGAGGHAQRGLADRRHDRRAAGRLRPRVVHGRHHGTAVPAVLRDDRRVGRHLGVQRPDPLPGAVRPAAAPPGAVAERLLRRLQPLVRPADGPLYDLHPDAHAPRRPHGRVRGGGARRDLRRVAQSACGIPARRG